MIRWLLLVIHSRVEMIILSIFSINSMASACCKLYVCQYFIWHCHKYWWFWVIVYLPFAKQRIFNCVFEVCLFCIACRSISECFGENHVTHSCEVVVHETCAFLEHPVCWEIDSINMTMIPLVVMELCLWFCCYVYAASARDSSWGSWLDVHRWWIFTITHFYQWNQLWVYCMCLVHFTTACLSVSMLLVAVLVCRLSEHLPAQYLP